MIITHSNDHYSFTSSASSHNCREVVASYREDNNYFKDMRGI